MARFEKKQSADVQTHFFLVPRAQKELRTFARGLLFENCLPEYFYARATPYKPNTLF